MMTEKLDGIAKKRNQLIEFLKLADAKVSESINASESTDYIKEKIIDFKNGFYKLTDSQKKLLIRKTIKKLILTKDNRFYLSENDHDDSDSKLSLVRYEDNNIVLISSLAR